jgi:calcineurin-like phosphoesterase family protein/2'-5' RNA ligase
MGIFDLFKEKKHARNHNYLIEIRFSGYVKDSIKELKDGISRNFHVTRRKIVPHVTLVGPLATKDEKRLIKDVVSIAKNYKFIKLKLDGFGHFRNDVIYVKINPSEDLEKLRVNLVDKLKDFCILSDFDTNSDFTYHTTIVLHDISQKFDKIWDYVQTWKIPEIEQYVIRITILTERRRILKEYDLLLKKTLNRSESLDKTIFRKSIKKLQKFREEFEPNFKFSKISDMEKIYFFSDTHFDHRNIIRYCRRPFHSTREMNHELLTNWNDVIGENDTIYFLGDMSYGRRRHPIDYWLGKLNGNVNYIRGNHDIDIITRAAIIPARYGIQYNDYKFLLMHDPYRPLGYDGWIIHGDKHNNSLKRYPFINQKTKTINVSAELVNYTPLSLSRLIPLIDTGNSFRTINEPI